MGMYEIEVRGFLAGSVGRAYDSLSWDCKEAPHWVYRVTLKCLKKFFLPFGISS